MKTDCLAIENPHYYKTNSIPSEPPDVKYSDSLTSISNQVCNEVNEQNWQLANIQDKLSKMCNTALILLTKYIYDNTLF